MGQSLTHLQQLEAESIHIFREVAAEFLGGVGFVRRTVIGLRVAREGDGAGAPAAGA